MYGKDGSVADGIYVRLSFTNSVDPAALLILFVNAHIGTVNCNGWRIRISGVLTTSALKHAKLIGAHPARYVIEHMHITPVDSMYVTSVLELTGSHAYEPKIVNTKFPRRSPIRGLGKGSSIALIRSAARYRLKRYAVVGLRRIKGSEGVY